MQTLTQSFNKLTSVLQAFVLLFIINFDITVSQLLALEPKGVDSHLVNTQAQVIIQESIENMLLCAKLMINERNKKIRTVFYLQARKSRPIAEEGLELEKVQTQAKMIPKLAESRYRISEPSVKQYNDTIIENFIAQIALWATFVPFRRFLKDC